MPAENHTKPKLSAAPTFGREEVRHFLAHLPAGNFFQALADFLALTLQIDYALIGYLSGHKPETIVTVGQSSHGQALGYLEYELPETPCENVVGRNLCYYPVNVAQLFPKDQMLTDLNIQSYLGIPLNTPQEKPLGLICVMDKKTIENAALVEQVLEEVKSRCEQELFAYVQNMEDDKPKSEKPK